MNVFAIGQGRWLVKSRTHEGAFYVVLTDELRCTCPHHVYRHKMCFHIRQAVKEESRREEPYERKTG